MGGSCRATPRHRDAITVTARNAQSPAVRIPPPEFLADSALRAVLAALPEARLVGGCVRDAVVGRPVHDIDLATPRHPEEVSKALTASGIKAVPTGIDHGTVTAVDGGRSFEITTLRRDVETDGRHAVVSFTDDWQEDAARRDFTFNAMSMTPDGNIYDYFDGLTDLRAGVVRFVGDPAARIAEDFLRVLRFFRFHARYALSPPDPAALAAIAAAVPGLQTLSAERIWSELSRILKIPDPRASIRLMRDLGVLAAIMPEGAEPNRLDELVASGAPPDPILRLAALLTGDPQKLSDRLRLSGAERALLVALKSSQVPAPGASDDDLRRALADTNHDILAGRAWLRGGDRSGWAELRNRLSGMVRPSFPLEGRHVLALGIAPGPRVGTLLRQVRDWWMDSGCRPDEQDCLAELGRLIGG